jgi:hypothetical protein
MPPLHMVVIYKLNPYIWRFDFLFLPFWDSPVLLGLPLFIVVVTFHLNPHQRLYEVVSYQTKLQSVFMMPGFHEVIYNRLLYNCHILSDCQREFAICQDRCFGINRPRLTGVVILSEVKPSSCWFRDVHLPWQAVPGLKVRIVLNEDWLYRDSEQFGNGTQTAPAYACRK